MFDNEARLLSQLTREGYAPAVVYDIGASNGIWSETILAVLPNSEFHMFEPLADLVDFYRADLAARSARMRSFNLHRTALGEEAGQAEFFLTHDGFGSSMLDRGDIPEVAQRVPVQRHRLDDYVAEHNLPQPNVVKIDCQGAERVILNGAANTLQQVDVLLLETWLVRGYGPQTPLLGEMIDYLTPKCFTLVETGEKFFDDRHRLYSIDAFFFSEKFMDRGYLRKR